MSKHQPLRNPKSIDPHSSARATLAGPRPRNLHLWLLSLLWVCSIQTASAPLSAQSNSGKITKVASNGDIHFSDGKVVRLQGIDLPSTSRCYGDERQRYMEENLVGKSATYTVEKADLMGKDLAYVNVGGDVGADLISAGYGFALLSFSYEKQERYERAQANARVNSQGLWNRCEVECDARGCKTESAFFSCGGSSAGKAPKK